MKKIFIFITITISIIFLFSFIYNMKNDMPKAPLVSHFEFNKHRYSEVDKIVECQNSSQKNINSLIEYIKLKAPNGWSRISLFVDYVPIYKIKINREGSYVEIYENWIMIFFKENNQKIPISRSFSKEEIISAIDIMCKN